MRDEVQIAVSVLVAFLVGIFVVVYSTNLDAGVGTGLVSFAVTFLAIDTFMEDD